MEPIELPPEANPLSPQLLLKVLSGASSTDPQQVQTATQQLQNWEHQPGYYSSLQSIFIDKSLPVEVRYISVTQLKHAIDKYWRKTAQHALKEQEKTLIRSRCIEAGIIEPDHRLTLQNAIIVAKIIRHEFPNDWPDALKSVIQSLDSNIHRALVILLEVVKELSRARLQRSRVGLYNASPEILQVLMRIYSESPSDSLLALRVMRRLMISGFDHPNRHRDVHVAWEMLYHQFVQLSPQLEKHVVQISKLHLNMVTTHPNAFPQLPNAIQIAKAYWNLLVEYGKEGNIPEKLILNGLRVLRGCVKMVYNPAQTFRYLQAEDKEERAQSTVAMKEGLLSETLIREMMETLVVRYFVFRQKDLDEWETEPDEWERREEGESEVWEFSIRICAEKLFLDLVINNKALLVQPLLGVFYSVASPENTDVLLKDSIYSAIGIAAPVLEKDLDFDAFLRSTLAVEVLIQRPGYKILRRRIAIIIGQWIVVKGMNRALVYEIFQFLLDKDNDLNDLVVRVTAGRQMKHVIDNYDIQIEQFTPFARTILGRLINLVEEVELVETKTALLNTISTIVIRMEHHVDPFADQIVAALPLLWDQAGDDYVVKTNILGILSALMTSIKQGSARFHGLILPLIASSVEPQSETRTYLLDDALDLWSSVLAQAAEPTKEMLDLVGLLDPMFDTAGEEMRKALELTESYVLLAPQAMLERSVHFMSVFAAMLRSKMSANAIGMVTHIVELFVQAAHNIGGPEGMQQIVATMMNTDILPLVLAGLKSAYDASLTSGPNKKASDIEGTVETEYLCILARIAVSSPSVFAQALSTRPEGFEAAIGWLLPEWLSHFEQIPNVDNKKLSCLALTALFELIGESPAAQPQSWILSHLQQLMGVWTDVVTECMDGGERDTLVYDPADQYTFEGPESPEDVRKRRLLYLDPVHRIDVKAFVRDHLNAAIAACGGHQAFQAQWLVNVDADVFNSFGGLGIL